MCADSPVITGRWLACSLAVAAACWAPPASAQPTAAPAAAAPATPAIADTLKVAFTQVAENASKLVVSMRVETRRKLVNPLERLPFGEWFTPRGREQYQIERDTGSGVVIRGDGYILTNKHVVEDASRVEVVFQDGRRLVGKIVGIDDATDLAVVKVEAKNLSAARFADSTRVRPGQWAIAIGSPFGLDYTVTVGVVSAVGRGGMGQNEIEDYLQTDASINPGNSGGPLVNLQGEVLGINTMIVGGGTGIGFAIPANLARLVGSQLIERGSVQRAFIGVEFQALTPELAKQFSVQSGALVTNVQRGGPADKAGVKVGDVVVSLDAAPIRETRELSRILLEKAIGVQLRLGLVRDAKPLTATLTTTERKPSKPGKKPGASGAPASLPETRELGLRLETLTPERAARLGQPDQRGAVVASLVRGSTADRAGLAQGDVIVEADHAPVVSAADVDAALADGTALLRVLRGEGATYLVVSKPK